MSRVFLDTNVPMYAGGVPHPQRDGARRAVLAVAGGEIDAVTDSDVFQEILYRYLRTGEREKGLAIFDSFYRVMFGRILPVDAVDARSARDLADRYPHLSARDLVHLAVMLRHQIAVVVTADVGFDAVPDLRRIDPAAFTGQL